MEKKDMIMQEYALYSFEDIEIEEKAQVAKANNANLSPVVRMDGLQRMEVIEVVKQVYMEVAKKGMSPFGMRFDAAFYIATGVTLDSMKTGMLGSAGGAFVRSTDKVVDVAFNATRTGLNKFATWLSNKTQK
jgi:hypothetical protein